MLWRSWLWSCWGFTKGPVTFVVKVMFLVLLLLSYSWIISLVYSIKGVLFQMIQWWYCLGGVHISCGSSCVQSLQGSYQGSFGSRVQITWVWLHIILQANILWDCSFKIQVSVSVLHTFILWIWSRRYQRGRQKSFKWSCLEYARNICCWLVV